jgi:hypothetical protein
MNRGTSRRVAINARHAACAVIFLVAVAPALGMVFGLARAPSAACLLPRVQVCTQQRNLSQGQW